MIENRITLITGLQASEIALLAILITSKKVNAATLLVLACALGVPTLLLTYIAFLRAVDGQVTQRRYIHALNAIRAHFVAAHPHIGAAIRMPTSTKEPGFSSIGSHSSMLESMAGTMLIITVTLATVVTSSISWLALRISNVTTIKDLLVITTAVAIGTCCATTIVLTEKMRRTLRQAAANN